MKDEGNAVVEMSPSPFVGRPSSLVDTHCHLGWHTYDADRDEVVQRAIDAGVTRIMTIGIDVASSWQAIEIAERYAAVYAAVGVHPNSVAGFDDETLNEIRALAQHPKVVAIGEIGLDNYWKKVSPEAQTKAFVAQLELAADIGKPAIIHSRDTTDAVLTMLTKHVERYAIRNTPGVLHSFSGNLDLAQRAFGLGFLIGFSGPVTFKKSDALRALARAVPADRFVIETDAPYLAPEPRRGRRNEPAYVRYIAERIAHERQVTLEEIAVQTTANAARLFGWTSTHGTASS
jgi:TatD DNase family protein